LCCCSIWWGETQSSRRIKLDERDLTENHRKDVAD
jgi:hypothetical protein